MTDDAIRCPVCQRREPATGRYVCTPCLGRIDDDLARIVELTRLASGWLTPRSNPGSGTRSVPASKPPIDLASLDAVCGNDVLPVLESWCRLIREEAHLAPYGAATAAHTVTVDTTVTWLRSWLLWASEAVGFPVEDYAREVRDLRWQLEALDPDRDKPGLRIPCPADHADGDGRSCGYRLVLTPNLADDVPCPRCSTTWTGNRLILVALNDPGVTVWAYPDMICDLFGINGHTLRTWSKRGHVRRNGTRYDVGDCYRKVRDVA